MLFVRGEFYMNTKDDEQRINELIVELSECREDERNTQNQILQVISVAGAVLGVLLGTSYFGTQDLNAPIVAFANIEADKAGVFTHFVDSLSPYITYSRFMFLFSCIIFCTAFSYVLVLGTHNVLRYYYIQNLEDRLHKLISGTSDDEANGPFIHWNAYIAPIITRNPRHIKSRQTRLAFISYSAATFCAVIFSATMAVALFIIIFPKTAFDWIVAGTFAFVTFLVMLLFFQTSNHAKEAAQFAWNMGRENQAKRIAEMGHLQYETDVSFKQMFRYLLYPKLQDPQKPGLIILGLVYGILFMNTRTDQMCLQELIKLTLDTICWPKLMFTLFVFDFLAYQARYQINDIRGLQEDQEAKAKNRLPLNACKNPGDAIKISAVTALIKILASIAITVIWGGEIQFLLLISLGALLLSTISYEAARAMKRTWLIYFLVGAGYPLRFFLGLFLAVPLEAVTFGIGMIYPALWAYGSFSALLPWTSEVTKRLEHAEKEKSDKPFPPPNQKQHFTHIQELIIKRYYLAKTHLVNGKALPLREAGSWRGTKGWPDPWNLAMTISMVCLSIAIVSENLSFPTFALEFVICLAFYSSSSMCHWIKLIPMCIGWTCIIMKLAMVLLVYPSHMGYLLPCLLQILVTVTYFILYYQPQTKKVDYKKCILFLYLKLLRTVLGKHAFSILYPALNSHACEEEK